MAKKSAKAKAGNHQALLIGVAGYQTGFDPLRGPLNDVDALAELLGSPPLGMYDVTPVKDPADEMASTISEFLENATPNDDLVVYFSGHGAVDDSGKLYLTHARSRTTLRGSGLKYDDFQEWVQDSQARSVLVVLDCCRAGKAGRKGSDELVQAVRDALRDARSRPQRVRVVLAAVPGHLDAEDAKEIGGLSPFTERLCEAIRTAEPRADGVVDLSLCVDRLRQIYNEAGLVAPRPTGTIELDAIELARRPDFVVKLLEREGLTLSLPKRTGVATERGIEIIVPTAEANSTFSELDQNHPAAVLVGGKEGTGKTWLLCDVVERVTAAGWTVHGFRPSGTTPQHPALLVEAIGLHLQMQPSDGKVLVVVDGVEWSDQWRQVVEQMGAVVREFRASLLIAAESLTTTDWKVPGGTTTAAPGTFTGLGGFIRGLIGGGFYPELSRLSADDREGLESELKELAKTDLWAVTHLAPFVTRPDAIERAGERLWRDRVVALDDSAVVLALQFIAALSSYGIWVPVNDISQPGVAIAQRLGADTTDAGVRINSSFINRALLARVDARMPPTFNWHVTAKRASEFVRMYITSCLKNVEQHDEATALLARLKVHRTGFDDYVTKLTEPDEFTWTKWETCCMSAATVAATLLVIRSSLPPKAARELVGKLAERVEDGQVDQAPVSVLLDCLQVLRGTPGVQRDATMSGAWEKLVGLLEERLTAQREEAETRMRALRLLHRFGSTESVATLRTLGPLLLVPRAAVGQEDLRVLVEIGRLLERSGSTEGRRLRRELPSWPEARDLVEQGAKRTGSRSAGYLVRWLVAARIVQLDTRGSEQEQRLLRVLRSAAINELYPIVDFCHTHQPELARTIIETLENDSRLRGRLLDTAPHHLADWIQTLARTSPRKAAMQLRRGQSTLNKPLLTAQEKAIRASSNRVACGRLLGVTSRVEDQTGLLENGFAAALASALGTEFLATQLIAEHRPSVMAHLITGFLNANVRLDDALIDKALEIVNEDVRTALTERGPRLALILADSSADGERFLKQLRGFPAMSRGHVGEYMRIVREPAAVAAFHQLGVLLYPDIAADYLHWLDEDDLRNRTFLRDIRDGLEPIPALEAAGAIAATLRLAGDTSVGRQLLALFDQYSLRGDRDWKRQLWQLEPVDLPRGLSLLHKLSPEDARAMLRASPDMLVRKLSSSVEMPQVFFSLLHVAARCDGPGLVDLVDQFAADGTFSLVGEQVGAEADLFTQIEVLHQAMLIAERTARQVLPDALLEELFSAALSELPVLTNPRIIARLLESVAAWRRPTADAATVKLNIDGLRTRFSHRRQDESRDAAHLLDVLFDLAPSRTSDVLDESTFAWLLAKAPIDRLSTLVEVGLREFPAVDTARIVRDRFTDIGGRPFTQDTWEVCVALGDVAWSVHTFGSAPLDLPAPTRLDLITRLPADTALHALAWLPASPWRDEALAQVLPETSSADSSAEAATLLAAHLHLGRFDSETEDPLWALACSAPTTQLRPLAHALTTLSAHDRSPIVLRHQQELTAALERIRTGPFAWRRHAQQTIKLLTQVLDNG